MCIIFENYNNSFAVEDTFQISSKQKRHENFWLRYFNFSYDKSNILLLRYIYSVMGTSYEGVMKSNFYCC